MQSYSRENQRKPNQSGTNVKTHQKIKPNDLTEALHEPQTPNKSFICCDEGLTVEKSASKTLYGGECTLLTQLIKPNYLVIPHRRSNTASSESDPICEILCRNPRRQSDVTSLITALDTTLKMSNAGADRDSPDVDAVLETPEEEEPLDVPFGKKETSLYFLS